MTFLPALLLVSFVMTIGLILLGVTFLQADRVQRRLDDRLDRVTNGLIIQETDPLARPVDVLVWCRGPLGAILRIAGIDLSRAPDYPLPWWAVLGLGVVLARAVVFLVAMVFGSIGLLAWPVMTVLLTRFAFGTFHARRSAALLAQFPDTLATIVRCVRVGIPVQEALRVIAHDMPAPTSAEFTKIADEVAIGTPLDQALRSLATCSRLPEYAFFATALSLQARAGGGLAQTLETLSEVIRKRVAMKARGYALAAEARTSATILGAIPIVAGIGIEYLQPHYLAALFVTRKGHIIFGLAVGMLLLGWMTMRTIIRRSLS